MEDKELAKDILDAVYGCLIGGAIGDAIGAPVEGWYYKEIREKYDKVTELMPYKKGYCGGPAGSVTDEALRAEKRKAQERVNMMEKILT